MVDSDIPASTSRLKLKGVKDSRIDKKKKKKKPKNPEIEASGASNPGDEQKKSEEKTAELDERAEEEDEERLLPGVEKTEAERRYEEMRRKRLNDRLKREGVKTHKERVEELNKYLSNLSEHHDMPRIGPG